MLKSVRLALIGLCVFSLGVSLGFATPLGIGEKVIEVKVDKKKVDTGEIFIYRIIVQGNLKSEAQLKLPEFKDLRIVSQSQSRNQSVKSGLRKTTINFTYHIFAPKAGVYTIEPVTLESKDSKYQSRTITIKVKGKPLKEKMKILPYIEKGTSL